IESIVIDGSLVPGDRIGAERELADSLGVSRWAVRKALENMETKGQILRTHGRSGGIFVAPKKIVRGISPLVGLPRYLQARGIESGTTVLATRAGAPEPEAAKQLGIESDVWVFRIERLRLAGGLPLVLEVSYFPCDLFPGLLDHPLAGSVTELLETKYGVERGTSVETISASAASREAATTLQVPTGAPLLSVSRTTELQTGRIYEFTNELYRADRTSITLRTDGTSGYASIEEDADPTLSSPREQDSADAV
ncbi:MAG: GntR family transcriptional regulator, partial [Actinomycetota bacterium]|nr:GntR family transcriptional regulator [Actinomycetota bacterium]